LSTINNNKNRLEFWVDVTDRIVALKEMIEDDAMKYNLYNGETAQYVDPEIAKFQKMLDGEYRKIENITKKIASAIEEEN